jgi:ribonuclease Z
MPRRLFRYLEPTFFAGQFDDPLLLVRVRPEGCNLLFDCGQVHHLAKRALKGIEAIFISHAHMDHFMGLDSFIRHNHASPRCFELFGPPGIADRLEHKLRGYDWNLHEASWCSLQVGEIHAETIERYRFAGPEGFARSQLPPLPRPDRMIYRGTYLQVEAELCDHRIPVLAFRLSERAAFAVDAERLRRSGLVAGPWLRELKRRFCLGTLAGAPIRVLRRRGAGGREEPAEAEALLEQIRAPAAPASLGYLTDLGFTPENRQRVQSLLQGVNLLVCECAYLAAEQEKARSSYHLCSRDLNALLAELRPDFVLPMHLSKVYLGRGEALYRELDLPAGTRLLRLPEHLTPRPLLPSEAVRLP